MVGYNLPQKHSINRCLSVSSDEKYAYLFTSGKCDNRDKISGYPEHHEYVADDRGGGQKAVGVALEEGAGIHIGGVPL